MPIYEYQCSVCGHQMEAFQKISDEALTECPKCHKPALNKLISASGFQLKGTGWYATDYKSKSKSSTEGESKSETETKSSDAKPKDSSSNDTGAAST